MNPHCCALGQRLQFYVATAGTDLQHAARVAAFAVERRGAASARQLEDVRRLRLKKAEAVNNLDDHQELCTSTAATR